MADSSAHRLGVPSRNPLPLSASQESQVRDIYYARVRKTCAEEIKAFAECAQGKGMMVTFSCRAPHRVMNNCMKENATQAEYDASREEWFAQRLERQRAREEKTKVAAAQKEFLREWWGLPESEQQEKKKQMEERVGGMPSKDRVSRA